MKVTAMCAQCILDQTKQGKQPRFNPVVGELDDNGTIHVTCDKNHYGVFLYNSRRYEVLLGRTSPLAMTQQTIGRMTWKSAKISRSSIKHFSE